MIRQRYIYIDNRESEDHMEVIKDNEGYVHAFIINLSENICLEKDSKIAVVGIKWVPKGKLKCVNENGKSDILSDKNCINICSDIVGMSLVNHGSLSILLNVMVQDAKVIDLNYTYPLYHELNVSMLSAIKIYFMDMRNRKCYINGSDYFQCIFHLIM